MKTCLAIGDLFVRPEDMQAGLADLRWSGIQVDTALFDAGDYDSLQAACLQAEKSGPDSVPLDETLRRRMTQADMIVVHFCPVGRSVILANPNLRLIGTCRTGLSNIDTVAAKEAEVTVLNCPGRLAEAVADFTVGLMICEARNIARGHEALRRGQWRRRYHNVGRIPDLPGYTVGLVGLGAIGRAVARRLRGFDMRVIASDPFVNTSDAASLEVELVPLDELLGTADFVSVHVDVRPETRNLIDRRRIGLMKPGAYFINTARGEVVDEAALVEALQQDRIAGAALDVYNEEPLPAGHPLFDLDNVTLTPHMSGGSDDAFRRSPRLLRGIIEEELKKREERS